MNLYPGCILPPFYVSLSCCWSPLSPRGPDGPSGPGVPFFPGIPRGPGGPGIPMQLHSAALLCLSELLVVASTGLNICLTSATSSCCLRRPSFIWSAASAQFCNSSPMLLLHLVASSSLASSTPTLSTSCRCLWVT